MRDDNQEIQRMISSLQDDVAEVGLGPLNLPEIQNSEFEERRDEIVGRTHEVYNDWVAEGVETYLDIGFYSHAVEIVRQSSGYEGNLSSGDQIDIDYSQVEV